MNFSIRNEYQKELDELQLKYNACLKALSIVNSMRDSEFKKKHKSRVFSNMNRIRGEINVAKSKLAFVIWCEGD